MKRTHAIGARRALLVAVVLVVLMAASTAGVLPMPHVVAAPASRLAEIPMPVARAAAISGGNGRATPFPLSHLAVKWQGDEAASVEVRWATAAGWQPWQAVDVNHDLTEGAGGTVFADLVRAD